jgi:hypothetical protein
VDPLTQDAEVVMMVFGGVTRTLQKEAPAPVMTTSGAKWSFIRKQPLATDKAGA